jgi:hypothetical protein
MSFLTFMLPRPQATDLLEPYLVGVHAAGGAVWVYGGRALSGPGPRRLLARYWNGSVWATHDRERFVSGDTELVSGFSDGSGGAWTSGAHFSFSTVAVWGGGAWTDVFTGGRQYLIGTSATDLYAIVGFVFDPPYNTLHYYYHSGGGWGARQDVTPTGTAWDSVAPSLVVGDGIPTNGLTPQGIRAVACPDGAVVLSGGGKAVTTLHRWAAVWLLAGGVATEVKLDDQEPAGATVRYDGLFAADNSHIYLIQGTGLFGGARTLYLWDRTPGDPWVSQTVPSWGCGGALHGVGPSDWWMLDDTANALQVSHWNGSAFTDYALPDPLSPDSGTTYLQGIWAAATSDVWVVGSSYNSTTGHDEAPVWWWDGATWIVQTVFLT